MHIIGKITISLALGLGLIACGGGSDGSGVDGSKTIISMSASERMTFCEWAIEEQGGAGTTHNCGDFTITIQTVAECVADFDNFSPTCTATVGQGESCVSAVASDPCNLGGSAECQAIFACQAPA